MVIDQTAQLSKRGPGAFDDGLSEPGLDRARLTSADPTSFTFFTSSSTGFATDQLGTYSTAVSFHGIQAQQGVFDFNHQYQHHQPYFHDQSQHFAHHLHFQPAVFQDQDFNEPYDHSKKRQKIAPNMDCFPFSRLAATQHGQEKSPESDYLDDEGCSRTTIFHSIGNSIGTVIGSVCAPSSNYGSAPGKPSTPPLSSERHKTNVKIEAYQAISPAYEVPVSRTYSTDFQSPSDMPRHLNVPGYNPEVSGPHSLVDTANLPAFTEQHPILQPGPPTNMRYQALDMIPKLESSSQVMKLEQSAEGEDFQHHNFLNSPPYMFSASSNHSAPAIQTEPGFYAQRGVAKYQAQYPTAHGLMSAEATQRQSFEYFLPSQTDESDMIMPNQKKPAATKRGPFKDPQKRQKTAKTRKIGSCIRCRMQRIRVRHDSEL